MKAKARRWYRWVLDKEFSGYELSSSAVNLQEVIAERYHWANECFSSHDVTVHPVKAPPRAWLAREWQTACTAVVDAKAYRAEIARLLADRA